MNACIKSLLNYTISSFYICMLTLFDTFAAIKFSFLVYALFNLKIYFYYLSFAIFSDAIYAFKESVTEWCLNFTVYLLYVMEEWLWNNKITCLY